MSVHLPEYIQASKIIDDPIQHEWDESDEEDMLLDQPVLTEELSCITYRGVLSFSLASIEWVVWRLSRHFDAKIAFHIIEAAWAGTIDWRYLKSLEVPEWWGDLPENIGGPLDHSFWLLKEAFIAARKVEPFWQAAASISKIAVHVMIDPAPYKNWRRFTIRRLCDHYPIDDDDLGVPVPKEALDPAVDYLPGGEEKFWSRFLQQLDHRQNTFLRSPEEMIDAGFEGTPYADL